MAVNTAGILTFPHGPVRPVVLSVPFVLRYPSRMRDFPPVLRTALWLAGARVLETKRPRPLVTDTFAERLLGDEGLKAALDLERAHPAPRAIIRRVRLVDELVTRYVKDRRIEVVIMAGTGVGARPDRPDLPAT